jgi:two-component system CheB/CheR fusion protein
VNEELHTINSDYQLKNKELVEINDDLNNYFRSNVNGQLFIDENLLLMKFSPGTVNQINLLESDIGRPLSNISTNIKFETIIDDIKKVLAEGCVLTKEIETNNGKWYQMMTMPYVQQADQKRNGAIITFNDITELKRIQQELDLSNKMLNLAIDAAAMGVGSINVKTREFLPSRRFKEIFSFYPDEPMPYEAVITQIDSEYQSVVKLAIETSINEGTKCDVEFPITGFHDQKSRWIKGVGNLSYDNDGTPGYFTGVLHDITILKQDEIRKNDFIGMVSHELKTPLTSLHAYVQMLAARAGKEEDAFAVTALDKANIQVKKMITLVNGFLNVSRFETGKIYLNEQTFEINTLMKEITEDFLMTITSHKIVLLPGLPLFVCADRDKIGQVITNFVNNAIKYSSSNKTITIACAEADGMANVSVKDEGIGINAYDQEKLFDRYFRVESAETQNIPGFGLGLYLSAEIVRRHHGNVWVTSEVGEGASFYFSLPLALETA